MANPIQEESMFVEFYTDAVELTFRSEQEGRPIFEDRAFVRILNPGDTTTTIERVATDADKQKYPKAWARFQRDEESGHTGTPLEKWPQITRSMVREAKHFEVHTVEHMAGISDNNISRMGMGFSDLRAKAKAYLDAASGTATATAQAAVIDRLTSQIEAMQAQMKDISDQAEKKRVGRPPKELAEA